MRSRKRLLAVVLIAAFFLVVWYANSVVMVEREHDLRLPESTRVVETDMVWWVPFSVEQRFEVCSNSVVSMSRSDFDLFIRSLDNCVQCSTYTCVPGSGFSLFPVEHGDVTHIHVIEVNGEAVVVELATVYT